MLKYDENERIEWKELFEYFKVGEEVEFLKT